MRIKNGRVFCADRFRDALLHLQNLHARLNQRGFKPAYLIRDLRWRNAITNNIIQVIANDMNPRAGDPWRDAYSFKANFFLRAVAHATARVKQMSNNASSV